MDIAVLLGRGLFCSIFLFAGIKQLVAPGNSSDVARARGVSFVRPWLVVVSGLALVAGGLSVLLGAWGDAGALVLLLFLASVTGLMHAFWRESEPKARAAELAQFSKNVALAGTCLVLIAVFAGFGDAPGFTLTGPLF